MMKVIPLLPILFHEDIDQAFAPLKKYNEQLLEDYMYMGHTVRGVYHYKHMDTREYLYIKGDGTLGRA